MSDLNNDTYGGDSGDFWDRSFALDPKEPLPANDDRYVDTWAVRGDFSFRRLKIALGMNPNTDIANQLKASQHILFTGHVGCGKSTELRRLVTDLNHKDRFFVVFIDAVEDLDVNNLDHIDVFMALASRLCSNLAVRNIDISAVFLDRLKSWFYERVEKTVESDAFSAEIKSGIEAAPSIPFFGKIFASLTTSFKSNATYTDELRRVVRNSYTEFAEALSQLVSAADAAVAKSNAGMGVLFVVDGTERLNSQDARRFFVEDVHQLQQVKGRFIYCAPITTLRDVTEYYQRFDLSIRMPMIKLHEKDDETPLEAAYSALRTMVHNRIPRRYFDNQETVDYIICHSGGHLRDLVRLLEYSRQAVLGTMIDRRAATQAVRDLATEFRVILQPEDYGLLREIDKADDILVSDRANYLLQHLAILEYNSVWWRSHPVVRTLPGYLKAEAGGGSI